jgi:hypothetical protein
MIRAASPAVPAWATCWPSPRWTLSLSRSRSSPVRRSSARVISRSAARLAALAAAPAGLEAAASRLCWFEQELVPGLFQTEDYARTLIRADNPAVDDAEIGRRVDLRMARQAIVRRLIDPPALRVALNESVLSRPVGGGGVMAGQLHRLAEAAELPNVALRVVPFAVGFHPGMLSGSFTILRFPLNGGGVESEPDTVYADLFTGALYLDKPSETERYTNAFEAVWQASLDESSSRDLIKQSAEDLRNV